MKRVMLVGCCLFLFVGIIALGQTPGQARFPFEGVVTGDHVRVRSGPDTAWYPVTKLMTGNRVRVVGEEYGWYKIEPPPGSFSWVEKEAIETTGDTTGKVVASRVTVRAGSGLNENERMFIQLMLGQGEQVAIIGEKGTWYKIEPPQGASVWISAKYVAQRTPRPKTTRKPIVVKRATDVTKKTAPSTQPTTQGVQAKKSGRFGPFTERIAELEKRFQAESKKPFHQRRWKRVLVGYRAVAAQRDHGLAAAYARARVRVIEYDMANRAGLEDLTKLRHDFEKAGSQSQQELIRLRAQVLKVEPAIWQGTGVLKISHVFTGPRMPKRYRLVDSVANRTVAYVELPPDSKIVVETYLNKRVAVLGQVYYDPKLKTNIIKATEFHVKPLPTRPGSTAK